MLKGTFIHSTKHVLNTYHVPATENTNRKVTSQAAHFNQVIRQVNRQLQHHKFSNTDILVAMGYCGNTYKKHQMLTGGKGMETKWGHKLSL